MDSQAIVPAGARHFSATAAQRITVIQKELVPLHIDTERSG